MPLFMPEDKLILSNWGISSVLKQHRNSLIDLIQIVHSSLDTAVETEKSSKGECEDLLTFAILTSPFFDKIIKSRLNFTPQSIHERVSRALARYVLDQYWAKKKP